MKTLLKVSMVQIDYLFLALKKGSSTSLGRNLEYINTYLSYGCELVCETGAEAALPRVQGLQHLAQDRSKVIRHLTREMNNCTSYSED